MSTLPTPSETPPIKAAAVPVATVILAAVVFIPLASVVATLVLEYFLVIYLPLFCVMDANWILVL